jgi:hypothetical protein
MRKMIKLRDLDGQRRWDRELTIRKGAVRPTSRAPWWRGGPPALAVAAALAFAHGWRIEAVRDP